jgi:hypothetical protein
MRAAARLRAALQIGQRQRHFISWNRTTKETVRELIQANDRGFDRQAFHRDFNTAVVGFFQKALDPYR